MKRKLSVLDLHKEIEPDLSFNPKTKQSERNRQLRGGKEYKPPHVKIIYTPTK